MRSLEIVMRASEYSLPSCEWFLWWQEICLYNKQKIGMEALMALTKDGDKIILFQNFKN